MRKGFSFFQILYLSLRHFLYLPLNIFYGGTFIFSFLKARNCSLEGRLTHWLLAFDCLIIAQLIYLALYLYSVK